MRPAVAALAAALAACSANAVRYAAPDLGSRMPASIAVLPLDNESVSLRGPVLARKVAEEAAAARGLSPMPAERVDEALRELGVTDGGQLGALDAVKLGAALGVPGLLYGTLEEFTYQNVGFVRRRVVRVAFKLVDSKTGERLWEAVGTGSQGRVAGKERAGRSFLEGMVEQATEQALGVPLLEETREAVENALPRLIGRMP